MTREYQICTKCIMDTTDPEIEFDEQGQCNYCKLFERYAKKWPFDTEKGKEQLDGIIREIKDRGKGKEFDCIIGLSGGADSCYVAYKAVELGLRPLAFHFDSGWNSEISVSNIKNLVKKLNIPLHTHLCDWEEMRDLQLAFFKASVANLDVPQDHAYKAALLHKAYKEGIKYLLSGSNLVSESILPSSWGYNSNDLKHLKGIQKQFGTMKLNKYPTINFFQLYIYYPYIVGIKTIALLNYMTYNKKEAKDFLKREFGWRDYGEKHHESIFTRFFQSYILPKKFGYDKRKAHLSSLIASDQITREEALKEMERPLYSKKQLKEDKGFVLKKMGIKEQEFQELLELPNKSYEEYPSNHKIIKAKGRLAKKLREFRGRS